MTNQQMMTRALQAVAVALKAALLTRLAQRGLGKSALAKSVKVEVKQSTLDLYLNDYYVFLEKGRRVGARKVPIASLLKWIRRAGVAPRQGQTLTGLAFAIQTAIYKRGQRKRPFYEKALNDVEKAIRDSMDTLLNDVFDAALAQWKEK